MNSKRLILLFLLVLVTFLLFKVVPAARLWKQGLNESIDQLQDDQARLERLLEKEAEWKEKLENLKRTEQNLVSQSLPGASPEVASARMQSILRSYADDAQMEVRSLSLPEIQMIGTWNLLQEVVTLYGSEAGAVAFLVKAESGQRLLRIVGFELRTDRSQLRGSATVVGFSPIEADDGGGRKVE